MMGAECSGGDVNKEREQRVLLPAAFCPRSQRRSSASITLFIACCGHCAERCRDRSWLLFMHTLRLYSPFGRRDCGRAVSFEMQRRLCFCHTLTVLRAWHSAAVEYLIATGFCLPHRFVLVLGRTQYQRSQGMIAVHAQRQLHGERLPGHRGFYIHWLIAAFESRWHEGRAFENCMYPVWNALHTVRSDQSGLSTSAIGVLPEMRSERLISKATVIDSLPALLARSRQPSQPDSKAERMFLAETAQQELALTMQVTGNDLSAGSRI